MNSHHQSEMSEALRIAVERGHIERVVDLLKRGAPSVLDQEGQTPLHIAASAGHIQLVDALIQAGCDVTVQDFVSHLRFKYLLFSYLCTYSYLLKF
jgi:ankyrin repeat protein